jgi:hypothetical protein
MTSVVCPYCGERLSTDEDDALYGDYDLSPDVPSWFLVPHEDHCPKQEVYDLVALLSGHTTISQVIGALESFLFSLREHEKAGWVLDPETLPTSGEGFLFTGPPLPDRG